MAYWYGLNGGRVLALDSDPAKDVKEWEVKRKNLNRNIPFTIAEFDQYGIAELRRNDCEWDLVFIDCPQDRSDFGNLIMRVSDVIITPIYLGALDVDALEMMESNEIFSERPKLIVINRVFYHQLKSEASELEWVEEFCYRMQCQYVVLHDRKEFMNVGWGIMPWDTQRFFRLFAGNFF